MYSPKYSVTLTAPILRQSQFVKNVSNIFCTELYPNWRKKNVVNGFKISFNVFNYATLRLYLLSRISHYSDIKLKYSVPKCTEIGQKLREVGVNI